jgi:tetratricopeptide (TPR) repeat protein
MTLASSDFNTEEHADATLVVRLLGTLARSASAKPGSDIEVRLLRTCAAITDDLHVVDGFSLDCLGMLVLYSIQRKEVDEAVALSRREVALRRQIDDAGLLAQALGRQSQALESAEQWEQALEALLEAFSAAQHANEPDLAVTLLLDRARILATRVGRFEEALRILQDAHDLGDRAGRIEIRERVREQIELALSWVLQSAGTAEDAGETDTATRLYLLIDETARTFGMPAFAAQAQCNHARMLAATMGQPDRALPLVQSALALAREQALADKVQYATQLIRAIRRDLKNR